MLLHAVSRPLFCPSPPYLLCFSLRRVSIAAQLLYYSHGRVFRLSLHSSDYKVSIYSIAFALGYIEDLRTAEIAPNSVDLEISNCVINLSPDKEAVIRGTEIFTLFFYLW